MQGQGRRECKERGGGSARTGEEGSVRTGRRECKDRVRRGEEGV